VLVLIVDHDLHYRSWSLLGIW